MIGLRDVFAAFCKAFGPAEPPVTEADILPEERRLQIERRFFGYCAGGYPSDYWPDGYRRDRRLLDRHEQAIDQRKPEAA